MQTQTPSRPRAIRNDAIRENIVYTNGHRDLVVVSAEEKDCTFITLPVRQSTPIEREERDRLKAERAIRPKARAKVDEYIVVDALLYVAPICETSNEDVLADFHAHPDADVLDCHDLPWCYHHVRCASVHLLNRIINAHEHVRIKGLDFRMPTDVLPYLQYPNRVLRLSQPSVEMGIRIAHGHRLTLSDCREQAIWIERRWNGIADVMPMDTDAGGVVYEILGGQRGGAINAVKSRDWLCESQDLREAVDTAALLNASSEHLLRSMRGT